MKTPFATFAALACAASYGHSQILFSDNFNSQTVGNSVAGWTFLSPTTSTASRGVVIVNDGPSDNSVRFYDTDTGSTARIEQDFTPRSDIHLSLNFRRNADIAVDPVAASTTAFYVTIGANTLAQTTQANRDLEFRLFSNGQYRINRATQDGGGNFSATALTTTANFEAAGPTFNWHSLDIFMYDGTPGGATKAFMGPDLVARILDPNSFAVFIDGVFITPTSGATANGDFGIFQSSIYGTDNNFGRLGLITGGASAQTGFDYLVDDVVLSGIAAVPEPSTCAILGFGGLAFLIARRRR